MKPGNVPSGSERVVAPLSIHIPYAAVGEPWTLHREGIPLSQRETVDLAEAAAHKREPWPELAGLMDNIQVCAKPADREWVSERIDALLLMNGISSRAESGDILEGPTAMPEPSDAMRVEVARLNRFPNERDPAR